MEGLRGETKLKVLFLPLASINEPGSRYRVYQYLDYLQEHGIEAHCKAGVSDYIFARFAPHKGVLAKAIFFALGALSRILACLSIWRHNVIFIQRLILPHVYPIPEMAVCLVARLLGKKVIFDFDDAIFTTAPYRNRTLAEKLSDPNRVARIIARCDAVIAGNGYLAAYARRYNNNVSIIPTSIDLDRYPVKQIAENNPDEPYVIGWIGMPSSLPNLNVLKPVFQELAERYPIVIRVIGGQDYFCPGVQVENLPWSLQDEFNLILSFNIGVMPLDEHEYSHGKCGLKLLQYMAAGIPAVASPIGVNKDIVVDGVNGFLALSSKEWIEKISNLIQSPLLRLRMGRRGRETVERSFSVQANLPRLIEILTGIYAAKQNG